MKKKTKLIMMFMSLCLVVSLGVLGIFAVKTLNMNVGGNISFSADGIDVSVSQGKFYTTNDSEYTNITTQTGKMQGFDMNTNTKLSDIQDKLNSWSNLVLALDSKGDAVLKFTVTNNMSTDALYIHTTISLGANKNNNMDIVFSPSLLTIEATEQKEISITFDILNPEVNAGLEGFDIGVEFTKVFEVNNGGSVSGEASEKFTKTNYEINANGGVTVSAKQNISGEVAILGAVEIEGIQYEVTEIAAYAFKCYTKITSVNIPNNVTKIGNQAFYGCSALKQVRLPSNLEIIGDSAFYNCSELSGNINLPRTLTTIGKTVFYYCTNLSGDIYISENVTSIGVNPFISCAITSIKVDPNNAYYDSRNNCNAIINSSTNAIITACDITTIPDSVSEIYSHAFMRCTGRTGDLVIPSNIKKIGDYAFYGCYYYTGSLILSEQVETVGRLAFYSTRVSGDLYIPATLRYVSDENPFSTAGVFTSIVVDPANTVFDSRNNCNAIIRKSDNKLVAGCGATVIPNDTKIIGGHAFFQCPNLKTINLPNGLETIGSGAFTRSSLTGELIIPATVTTIVLNPFRQCNGITSIKVETGNPVYDSRNNCNAIIHTETNELITGCKTTVIPSSVQSVGTYALYYIGELAGDFVIPSNVKYIGAYALGNCTKLTSIVFKDPNNWVRSSTENKEDGVAIDFTNSIANKDYLTKTYEAYNFFKN